MSFLALGPAAIYDPAVPDPPWATGTTANPLRQPLTVRVPRLLAWSGWLSDEADVQRARFPLDFRVWTAAGWSALGAACDALVSILAERNATLLLRPHARQVLSDPQACVTFLRAREGQPIRLLLDAASMLTPAMLPTAEDHLHRIFSAVAPHPGVAAILLSNVRAAQDSTDELHPAPLHRGLLSPSLILNAYRSYAVPETPLLLLESEFEAQSRLL